MFSAGERLTTCELKAMMMGMVEGDADRPLWKLGKKRWSNDIQTEIEVVVQYNLYTADSRATRIRERMVRHRF